LWAWMGPRNHVLDAGTDPEGKEQFWLIEAPIVKFSDFLPSAVQKRLNVLHNNSNKRPKN